jgi:hypothetical protein
LGIVEGVLKGVLKKRRQNKTSADLLHFVADLESHATTFHIKERRSYILNTSPPSRQYGE